MVSSCISVKSIRNTYPNTPIDQQDIYLNLSKIPPIKYDGPNMNAKTFKKLDIVPIILKVQNEMNEMGAHIDTSFKESNTHHATIESLSAIVTSHAIKVNIKLKFIRKNDLYEIKASGTYYKEFIGDEKKMFEYAFTQALMEFYQFENK